MDALQQKQFELAYYAHTSLKDTDDLYPFELDSFYRKLAKRKKEEADAHEQALKNSKSQKSSSQKGRRR